MRNVSLVVSIFVLGSAGLATASSMSNQTDTAAVYKKRCASCHGADARGETKAGKMTKTPNLTDPSVWKTANVEERVRQLKEGAGKMPKFEGKISEEEMEAVSEYIRTLAGIER